MCCILTPDPCSKLIPLKGEKLNSVEFLMFCQDFTSVEYGNTYKIIVLYSISFTLFILLIVN